MGKSTLQAIQKQSLIKRLILVDSSAKEKNHIKSITFHEDNFIVTIASVLFLLLCLMFTRYLKIII